MMIKIMMMMGVTAEWAIRVARLRNRMLGMIVRLIEQGGKTAAI